MTWQDWIVGLLVLLCIIEVVRRIIRFFNSTKSNDNPCANCAAGCDLKRAFDEKKKKCKSEQKEPGKKCCG